MFNFKFKRLSLAVCLTLSSFIFAQAVYAAPTAKKQEVKKVEKKPVKSAAKKKEDGKIKPLEEGRKIPTLKKKYKKD